MDWSLKCYTLIGGGPGGIYPLIGYKSIEHGVPSGHLFTFSD